MLQLAEYHESVVVSAKPPKRPSMKERKQKLLAFLRGMVLAKDSGSAMIIVSIIAWTVLLLVFTIVLLF